MKRIDRNARRDAVRAKAASFLAWVDDTPSLEEIEATQVTQPDDGEDPADVAADQAHKLEDPL